MARYQIAVFFWVSSLLACSFDTAEAQTRPREVDLPTPGASIETESDGTSFHLVLYCILTALIFLGTLFIYYMKCVVRRDAQVELTLSVFNQDVAVAHQEVVSSQVGTVRSDHPLAGSYVFCFCSSNDESTVGEGQTHEFVLDFIEDEGTGCWKVDGSEATERVVGQVSSTKAYLLKSEGKSIDNVFYCTGSFQGGVFVGSWYNGRGDSGVVLTLASPEKSLPDDETSKDIELGVATSTPSSPPE